MSGGMAFGKIITEQSYHNGRVSVVTTRYQVPELVKDKSQADGDTKGARTNSE